MSMAYSDMVLKKTGRREGTEGTKDSMKEHDCDNALLARSSKQAGIWHWNPTIRAETLQAVDRVYAALLSLPSGQFPAPP